MKVVTGIKHNNTVRWIYAEEGAWFLDMTKIDTTLIIDTALELRKGFDVLTAVNVDSFVKRMQNCTVSTDWLRRNISRDDVILYPSLFVDFDGNVFYDNFPEPNNYSLAMPDGWTYSYDDFDRLVSQNEQYWIN